MPYDLRILTCTSSLLLVGKIEVCTLRDGLTEVDAWLARRTVDIVLSFHPLHINFKVQFTHARDNRLKKLRATYIVTVDATYLLTSFIHVNFERGIFFLESLQCS